MSSPFEERSSDVDVEVEEPAADAVDAEPVAEAAEVEVAEPLDEPVAEPGPEGDGLPEHAPGGFAVPAGYRVVEGAPDGARKGVAVVVSRFNGEITGRMLEAALDELEDAGVPRDAVTVVPVPGAFELPLAAMAFAKTRRYACVVALGCVIRGETAHFDYVAGEAASGLQLAALETGVPVAFGVLTCDTVEQAEARVGKGAEAVLGGLEMADLFAQIRAAVGAAAR
jgi:6,7-dimethyl-8-ribityllumazine synthase